MSGMREMMLDGTLCQVCGAFIEEPGAGVPRDCVDCANLRQRNKPKPRKPRVPKDAQ